MNIDRLSPFYTVRIIDTLDSLEESLNNHYYSPEEMNLKYNVTLGDKVGAFYQPPSLGCSSWDTFRFKEKDYQVEISPCTGDKDIFNNMISSFTLLD